MREKEKKKLSTKDVAQLLGTSLVTVQRWAYQGKIPCKLKKDGYFFKRKEIIEWAQEHDILLNKEESKTTAAATLVKPSFTLVDAVERGGVIYKLEGHDIYSALKEAVRNIPLIEDKDKEMVLDELINREEIASTGIGKGVAIPHPRRTLDLFPDEPVIPVAFLKHPVDFNAVDGNNVKVLFLMFSPSTKIHLKLLSKLSLCLRNKEFLTMLEKTPDKQTLLQGIGKIESSLDKDDA